MRPTDLIEHPEGGRYQRVFKSKTGVTAAHGEARSALTHIYYALEPGEVSRFHRVRSDEVWNLYQGRGLYLHSWDDAGSRLETHELSAQTQSYCHAVPAGVWQAAEPIDGAVLVGCSVGPGFEFEDFELIDPLSSTARAIQALDPSMLRLIDG